MKRLSFIGCGKAGRVLGRLWHNAGVFEIADVLTGSHHTALQAVGDIGAGRAIEQSTALSPADVFLIATPDRLIASAAKQLTGSNLVDQKTIVFHLSGATPSMTLRKAGLDSNVVASMHPLRSFGDFRQSVDHFADTWCGFEGDTEARAVLAQAFEDIGGNVFDVNPDARPVYHSACLMVSNFLNALVDAGMDCFAEAGVDRDKALVLSGSILTNTLTNILAKGPVDALTGPVSRGDSAIIAAELAALEDRAPDLAEMYRLMSRATLKTAIRGNQLDQQQIAELNRILAEGCPDSCESRNPEPEQQND